MRQLELNRASLPPGGLVSNGPQTEEGILYPLIQKSRYHAGFIPKAELAKFPNLLLGQVVVS